MQRHSRTTGGVLWEGEEEKEAAGSRGDAGRGDFVRGIRFFKEGSGEKRENVCYVDLLHDCGILSLIHPSVSTYSNPKQTSEPRHPFEFPSLTKPKSYVTQRWIETNYWPSP